MAIPPSPLPYKLAIFKNSIPQGDWDTAHIRTFDQHVLDPSLQDKTTPLLVLREFCIEALDLIERYMQGLNQNSKETPRGYAWCICAIHIERTELGALSCKEFAIVVELVPRVALGIGGAAGRNRCEGSEATFSSGEDDFY